MNLKWFFSFVFIVFLSVYLTSLNYKNREYDWDMPGYVGAVYKMEFPDSPDKVHKLTFQSIKKEASKDNYLKLSGVKPANTARQVYEKSAQSFSQQLPYYEIKVGYNLALLFLQKIGFSPPMSVLAISLLSYFFSAILIFFILKIIFPDNWLLTVLIVSGVMFFPPLILMSRSPTPDLFVFQFILIFLFGLLSEWKKWILFIILFFITLVRPDYVILTLTYLLAVFLFEYIKNKKMNVMFILQAVLLLCLYFIIIKYYHYPGWKNLFYDSFIFRRPMLSSQEAVFSVKDYFFITFDKLIHFKKVTLSAIILLFVILKYSSDLWIRILAVLFFINLYIKFFFFPQSGETRLFFPFIFPLFIIMLHTISKKYNGFKLNKIP